MPDVAVDSQYNVHVAWRNCNLDEWCQAYYAKKLHNETAFRSEKKLSDVKDRRGWVRIAVDTSDRVFVLWADEGPEGEDDLFLVRSDDGGNEFTPPRKITDDKTNGAGNIQITDDKTNGAGNIQIAIDSSETVHVTWMVLDDRFLIYYSKSTNHGQTFKPPVVANDNDTDIHVNRFDFDVDDSGNAHFLFPDGREEDCPIKMHDHSCSNLYYLRTYDGGKSFIPSFKVNDFNNSLAGEFDIAFDGYDNPHIVWRDIRDGDFNGDGDAENSDVYYTKSLDGGETFEPNSRVNVKGMNGEWYSLFLGASIDVEKDGSPHVTWMDGRNGHWDIYYTYSKDNGSSFVGDIRVSDDVVPSFQGRDDIVLDNLGRPHIVWQDNRTGDDIIHHESEIWYAMGDQMPVYMASEEDSDPEDADDLVMTSPKAPSSVESAISPMEKRTSLRKAFVHLQCRDAPLTSPRIQ
jgi:hypothetical protein